MVRDGGRGPARGREEVGHGSPRAPVRAQTEQNWTPTTGLDRHVCEPFIEQVTQLVADLEQRDDRRLAQGRRPLAYPRRVTVVWRDPAPALRRHLPRGLTGLPVAWRP